MDGSSLEPNRGHGAGWRRRRVGLLVALGLVAIAVGFYLAWPRAPSTHPQRFVPSPADLAVLRTGGTAVPTTCSDAALRAGVNDWALVIGPESAGFQFTVPARTLVTTSRGRGDTPLVSASAPVCVIGTGDGYGDLYLQRRGTLTAYFVSGSSVSVVRIVVTAPAPATIDLGLPLIVVGVLVCGAGGVLAYRRRKAWNLPQDLRRADDAERGEAFDPEKAQRAAWDAAIDQTSGIY